MKLCIVTGIVRVRLAEDRTGIRPDSEIKIPITLHRDRWTNNTTTIVTLQRSNYIVRANDPIHHRHRRLLARLR
jgi:hypothetical protein